LLDLSGTAGLPESRTKRAIRDLGRARQSPTSGGPQEIAPALGRTVILAVVASALAPATVSHPIPVQQQGISDNGIAVIVAVATLILTVLVLTWRMGAGTGRVVNELRALSDALDRDRRANDADHKRFEQEIRDLRRRKMPPG
jgi:hypothetical protein